VCGLWHGTPGPGRPAPHRGIAGAADRIHAGEHNRRLTADSNASRCGFFGSCWIRPAAWVGAESPGYTRCCVGRMSALHDHGTPTRSESRRSRDSPKPPCSAAAGGPGSHHRRLEQTLAHADERARPSAHCGSASRRPDSGTVDLPTWTHPPGSSARPQTPTVSRSGAGRLCGALRLFEGQGGPLVRLSAWGTRPPRGSPEPFSLGKVRVRQQCARIGRALARPVQA
jgi:hypothetical protein